MSYAYDSDGLRTSKTVNGVVHNYYYASGKLLRETYGSNVLDFSYDANGNPYALKYNGVTYYYITNLQGDVMYLVNSSGATVATYEYDPYGSIVSATGTMAEINPLRYRGYYYDTDTGFYYLQSRYYDPQIGRFLNADTFVSTGQGLLGNNMFAYCNNSPIPNKDSTGHFLFTAIGALVGGALGAISAAIEGKREEEFWASVASGAASGAVSGAAADIIVVTGGSAAVVAGAMAAAGALGAVASNGVESLITGEKMSLEKTIYDACWGAATGALFGYMGGEVTSNLGKYASRGFWKATRNILIREGRELVSSLAEEALSNVTAGLLEFTVKTIGKQIINTVTLWN